MGAAVAIIGAAVNVGGQQGAAASAQQAAEYQQDIAQNNIDISEILAIDAIDRGKVEEKRFRTDIESLKGTQRTALAKNGVVVNQDTALDIILDTAEYGEVGALEIRQNAQRDAFGFRAQGQGFAAQSDLAGSRGDAAQRAANIQSVSTILGTASRLRSE